MKTKREYSFPLTPLSVLGIVFVTLKLTENIDWSWWWVLAPFWGPWAALGVFFLVLGLVWLALYLDKKRRRRRALRRRRREALRQGRKGK